MSNRSESIGALTKALAKAQGAIKPAVKASENPFFKSSYADLPAIFKACRDELSKNDIAIIQRTAYEGETLLLETILAHSSGEWISGVYPVKPVKPDPQSMGSAITYSRRYALAAMVGVVAEDEDDDGAQASGNVRVASRDEKGEALNKSRSWAKQAIHDLHGFTPEQLAKWEVKNADNLVKLRGIDENTHQEVLEALQTAQSK